MQRQYTKLQALNVLKRREEVELVQGEPATASDPGAFAVGAIVFTTDGKRPEQTTSIAVQCSAMAIDRDLVVTAAHCFTKRLCTGDANTVDTSRTTFYFVQGEIATEARSSWKIDRFACHPDHERHSDRPCQADVAIAHLAESLPSGSWWSGAMVQPDQRELVKLGYGYYRHVGQNGSYEPPERRAIARFHIVTTDQIAGVYSYAAIAPDGRPIKVCEGDSGGPGIQERADGVDFVGVTSQFAAQSDNDICGPTGTDTTLAVFDSWLENGRAALQAGQAVESSCP